MTKSLTTKCAVQIRQQTHIEALLLRSHHGLMINSLLTSGALRVNGFES
ncbi:hypothetical protein [Endozoicomonas sp. 2B-B]